MIRRLCLAAVLLTISGCDVFELAALGANRLKWSAFGTETYRMEVRGECFRCNGRESGGPFTIEVAHGEIVKATYSDDGSPVSSADFLPTVEDLFEMIQEAAVSSALGSWVSVNASYHRRLGYPTYTGVRFEESTDQDYNYVVEYLHIQE